jgi:lipoprotein-releasing system permease protein
VSVISLGAVALGVAALIIVMSVMNGFRAELFDKIVGLNGHAISAGYGEDGSKAGRALPTTPGKVRRHSALRSSSSR